MRANVWNEFEHEFDRRMICAAHHFPGITVVVDMASPGQRLETDAQPAFGRALTQFMKIRRAAIDAADRLRRYIAAHQQRIAAQLLHQIEFSLGAIEGPLALRLRHAFEIAERLEGNSAQTEIGHLFGNVGRRAVVRQQVAFEDFHAVETGRCDRLQLFAQTTAETNRGYRGFHCSPLVWLP